MNIHVVMNQHSDSFPNFCEANLVLIFKPVKILKEREHLGITPGVRDKKNLSKIHARRI